MDRSSALNRIKTLEDKAKVSQFEAVEIEQPVLPELEILRARSASLTMREEPADLEVPEGMEGPVPTFALPGRGA